MRIHPPRIAALTALAATLLLGGPATAEALAPATAARSHPVLVSVAAVGEICSSDLPAQAHDTLDLIAKGGPYPYKQDGTVFQNREAVLPSQSTGYYHEYTVKTPGSSDRGARRIVTGAKSREDYYTADHYASFDRVDFGC
ncbi:ribonuclease [Streptomyces sp. NPDC007088]|uniref:ribonuclease n=1 Tax=Streptomyces sp. NPDC007088 TaxID=3364773 RepID=UPI0036BF18F3